MEAFISTTDLADELDVSLETVARWIGEGRFPGAFKRRARWCVPIAEAERFVVGLQDDDHDADDEDFEEEDD